MGSWVGGVRATGEDAVSACATAHSAGSTRTRGALVGMLKLKICTDTVAYLLHLLDKRFKPITLWQTHLDPVWKLVGYDKPEGDGSAFKYLKPSPGIHDGPPAR